MHRLRRYRNMVGLCLLVCALAPCQALRAQDETPVSEAPETEGPLTPIGENIGPTLPSGEPFYGNPLDAPVPSFATSPIGAVSHLPFHLSLAVTSGYDDNVNSSEVNPSGSAFVTGSLSSRYDFGTPRTLISIQGGGSVTDYFERSGLDYSGNLRLNMTHRVSSRMTIGANVYATYTSQPNFNLNLGINRNVGNYFYSTGELTLNYLWTPRFSTLSSYTLNAFFQEGQGNQPLTPGDLSNIGSTQDRVENTFSNQFRYLWLPTTTVLIEYRLGFINYQSNSGSNSITNALLAGFDHTFSPRFNASFRGGAEYRVYNNGGDSISPTFEANVNYVLGKHSSVSGFANYSLQPGGIVGSQERTAFRTGINGRYNWTARISSSLGVIYEHDDFGSNNNGGAGGMSFAEDTINLALSTRYAVTRYFGIQAAYNYTDVTSDEPMRPYSRNRISAGVDFTF